MGDENATGTTSATADGSAQTSTTGTTDTGQTQQTSKASTSTDETDWKAESRKWEQRAKENSTRVKELEKTQRSSMSDSERAVAEAEARGRTAAATDFGKRLARTEFDAAAARRNPDFDTASALEYVDLARLVDEHGEPDAKAIKAVVESLVPEPTNTATSFDGGARKSAAKGADMNSIIRQAAGLGG